MKQSKQCFKTWYGVSTTFFLYIIGAILRPFKTKEIELDDLMVSLRFIQQQEGSLPPRPKCLKQPSGLSVTSNDDVGIALMESGKGAALGGLSIIGEEGYMVFVISLLQSKNQELFGWLLTIGHPDKKGEFCLEVIDTTKKPLSELPFPNTMTYFVGEIDKKILKANTSQKELEDVARFIFSFISDEGPPEGIDW